MNISKSEQGKLSYESVLFDDDVKLSSNDDGSLKMSADVDFEPADTSLIVTKFSHDDESSLVDTIDNTADAEVQDEIIDSPK